MNHYCVTILRKETEKFGIVLKSADGTGSIVERVVEGSAADRCHKFCIGDRILAVNNINVLYVDFRITAFFIENSGNSVTLMFWSSEDNTPASMQGEESFVKAELNQKVQLFIAGGSKNTPLFIHAISLRRYLENGKLLLGDIIEEIQGESTKNMTCDYAMKLCRKPVTLLVKRGRCKELIGSGCRAIALHNIYPYSITVSRQGEDFGFIIRAFDGQLGSVLENVVAGSPAERCGQCPVGARIVAVDDFNVLHMDVRCTKHFIQIAGNSVTLTFCPSLGDFSTPATSQKQEEFRELMLYKSVNHHLNIFGGHDFPMFVSVALAHGDDYKRDMILVGDQILEINGKETKNMMLTEACGLFLNSSSLILLVKRVCCDKEKTSDTVPAVKELPSSVGLRRRRQVYDESYYKRYIYDSQRYMKMQSKEAHTYEMHTKSM